MTMTVRFALLSALLLTACGGVGNGAVTERSIEVGAFKTVDINSGITARVSLGTPSVTVRTDENLQHLVVVTVENGRLWVGHPPMINTFPTKLEVDIVTDRLEGVFASGAADVTAVATAIGTFPVQASGASSVTVEGVSSEKVTIDASGASEVTLSGAAVANGTAQASGASRVVLTELPFEKLSIDVSGASSLTARVSNEVRGQVSGASKAVVEGAASTRVETSGASTFDSK